MASIMSKVAWLVLRTNGYKKMGGDPAARAAYFEKLRELNRQPAELPVKKIRSQIGREEIDGVETIWLEKGRRKLVLYLHGGSYCEAPVPQHWQLCDRIARETDASVVFPLYKRAPEHRFEETFAFLHGLWERLAESVGAEHIAMIGDSAGGGLALAFAEYLLRETALPQPGQIVLFSPWLDIGMETEIPEKLARQDPTLVRDMLRDAGRNWAGSTDTRDYRLSPLFGELTGLAPLTLYVGTHEIFLPDARSLKARCEREGVTLRYVEGEKMNHAYALYPIPEGARVRAEVIAAIRQMP